MGPLPPRCGGASPPLPSPVEESSGLLPTVLRGCGFVGAHILQSPSRISLSNHCSVLCGHGALVRFFRGAMAGLAIHRPFRRAPSSRLHLRDALAFEPHRISRGRLGGHETSERRTWWTWWTRRTRRTSPRWRLWTWWRCEAAAGWEEQTAMAEGRADDGKRDG